MIQDKKEGRHGSGSCLWDNIKACKDCKLAGKLHCKLEPRLLKIFLSLAIPMLVFSFLGLILSSILIKNWWFLAIFTVFVLLFFSLLEIRILCSHCPYYAEDSRVLHCYANWGLPKLWKYRPEPMNIWEKIILLSCFVFLGLFSPSVQVYVLVSDFYHDGSTANLILLLIVCMLTFMSVFSFFLVLKLIFCLRCVNFSCPLNSVPSKTRDGFLYKNDLLGKWHVT